MNIQVPSESLFQWLDYRKIFQIQPGAGMETLYGQLWSWICQLTPTLNKYKSFVSLVINTNIDQTHGNQILEVNLNSKHNQPDEILILSQNGLNKDISQIQRYPLDQKLDDSVIKQLAGEICSDKQHMLNSSKTAFYCPFVNCKEEIKGSNDLDHHITIHTQDNIESQQNDDSDEQNIIPHASSQNKIEQVQSNNQTNTHQTIQDQIIQNMDDNRHNSLNVDIQIQGNSSRFRCTYPDCGKSFSRKSRLKAHLHLHWGTQPYRCEFPGCSKAFSERPNLIIHMRIHTKEKPFSCRTCGKRFTTKGNMKDHERRHLKQKPYSCDTCGQPFYRKNILNKHVQKCIHDPDYNEDQQYQYENQTQNDQIAQQLPQNINIHLSGSGSLGIINNQNINNIQGLFTNTNIIPSNQQIQQSIQIPSNNIQINEIQNPLTNFVKSDLQLNQNTDLQNRQGVNPQSFNNVSTNLVDSESKLNPSSSLQQQKILSTNQQSQVQSIKVQGNPMLSTQSLIPQSLFLQPIQGTVSHYVQQFTQPQNSQLQFSNQGSVLQPQQNYETNLNQSQLATSAQLTNPSQQVNDRQYMLYANNATQALQNQQQFVKPSQYIINSQGIAGLQNQRMLQYQYIPNLQQSSLAPQFTNTLLNSLQSQNQVMPNQYQPLQNLPSQYGQTSLTYLNPNPLMNQLGQFIGSNSSIQNQFTNQTIAQPQLFQQIIQPNNFGQNIALSQQNIHLQPTSFTTQTTMNNNQQNIGPSQQGVTQNEVQASSFIKTNNTTSQ